METAPGLAVCRRALLLSAAGLALMPGLSSPVGAAGSASAPAIGSPRLTSITVRSAAGTTSLLIQASEPVPYVTTRPDPLTILVDMRNVRASGVTNALATGGSGPIAQVSAEDQGTTDGASMARVRITLAHAATHRVRSARDVIYVDINEPGPRARVATVAPVVAPQVPAVIGPSPVLRPATPPASVIARADPRTTSERRGGSPISEPSADRSSTGPAAQNLRPGSGSPMMPGFTPTASGSGARTVATVLRKVRALAVPGGVSVILTGNGKLEPASVKEADELPARVVLDFAGVAPSAPATTRVGQGPIQRVRVAINSHFPLVTRVVIDLSHRTSYKLEPSGDADQDLKITFDHNQNAAPDSPPSESAPPTQAEAVKGPASPNRADDPIEALKSAPAADQALQDIPAAGDERLLAGKPPAPLLAEKTVTAPAASASMKFSRTLAAANRPDPPAVLAPALPTPAAPQPPTPPPAAAAPAQGVTLLSQPAGRRDRVFTGHPISLDFQGADLRAVLRTFAEISGLNLVIDPAVTGTVDVALREVPWDQALDIILRANKLGYVVDGTIVRIAPLNVLEDEEKQRRKLAEEQALSGDLSVVTRALSYARAEDMAPLLTRSALTQRGTVQVDPRTNTLIISDLPSALTTATDLISTLDKPQPQVEIEARIIQTTRTFARDLGVQWGFAGRVAPELGNTTGLAFPNSGSIGGRLGTQGPNAPGSAVNLPVGAATSAVGLALGSVNGSFNLDVALSALEKSGKGRILSTPRVSTQNNVEAEVTQGIQIPIQTIANNTVTVTFKDAALTLKVTPQITAANTVIMKVALENASPDFAKAAGPAQIPPINTQRANTQVLVSDGQTTVIGGIYTTNENNNTDRTPGLSRVPLLGWLFKREHIDDESRELLIFITPRIIR